MLTYILRNTAIVSTLSLLVACSGGGGGGGLGGGGNPPPNNGWQPGVFLDASTFVNQCAAPRTGQDPTNGNQPYPDVAGTTTDENNFLRSFTNNTYLWYDEIVDVDPATINDPEDYFAQMRTFQTTPSGTPKDQFSFSIDSLEWFNLSQGGVTAGYGAEFAILSSTPPREIIVAYTEPNSPATAPAVNLKRGTRILTIDGIDIDTNTQAGIDVLNAGLRPSSIGESHTFEVQDVGAATSRSVTIESATITTAMVQNTKVFDTPTGRVGYMTFNFHRAPAEAALVDAINTLNAGAGVDDLVLDLRYNGGGFSAIAGQLAYMIAGPAQTAGKTFDLVQFNDKHPATNPITGQSLAPEPFHDVTLGFSLAAGTPLPTLDLTRVFVLTGPGTCSASELIMNGLRGADVQVVQIGSTTCGKPYGFYEQPNCGISYFPIQLRGVNDKNFGDYSDGFVPSAADDGMANVLGCPVADDFSKSLGDAGEDRLEVALAYQAGMGCIAPVAVGSQNGLQSETALPLRGRDGVVHRSLFDSNAIRNRPE
ncbi:MAG: S41 family peptidase [Woeseiaceae bacterium]